MKLHELSVKPRDEKPDSLDKLFREVDRATMNEQDRRWYDALDRSRQNQ